MEKLSLYFLRNYYDKILLQVHLFLYVLFHTIQP